MRQPSILDVVRAVSEVGPSHPEVRSWWYAPPRRLRLRGDREADGSRRPVTIEVVVEAPEGGFDELAAELSRHLRESPVSVRTYRGAGEERQLYRLRTREKLRVVS
jgi:hypothetical protein